MVFEPVKVALPKQAPGLLRSYAVSQRNLLELIPEAALTAPILSGRTGVRWHLVMAPEAVGHVMQTHVENYPKSEMTRLLLEPALGDSILLAEGESWRRQRRAAAPAFAPRNVAALGPVMQAAARAMTEQITPVPGRAQDLLEDCVRATFDIISDTTFSGGDGMDRGAVMAALEVYLQETGRLSFLDVLGAPNWVPRPGRMKKSEKLQHMIDIADARIVERRQIGASAPPDLLDLLLEGQDAGLSDVDVRDNLLTFIISGHETTAITLAWALYLLGNDLQVQERARAEVKCVLNGATLPEVEHIAAMSYLRQVLDETLRLYPAAAFLSRQAVEADDICGTAIAPGDTVSVPIYAIQRHRALWENPDAFDPDRWANGTPVPRFGYLPFGDGPRICIGMSFAYQEALIVLASLLAQYRFTAVPGKSPRPEQLITLRPTGGVWLTVEPA